MKILVTGATGFIGSHLVKKLYEHGYQCRCLVRNINKAEEMFRNYRGVEFIVGDVRKSDSLKNIAKSIDVVFHLAALGHVSAASEEAYKAFYEVNVRGTDHLLKECSKNSIAKYFHFSSTAAVGLIPNVVVNEEMKPQPRTPYQKSKFQSEMVVRKFIEENNFPAIIVRPCMVFGIGGFGEFYKLTKLVKKGLMPRIGFKEKLTPLVNVRDIVQACTHGIEGARIGETYFLCGKKSYPFDEIIKYIKIGLNSRKRSLYIPESAALLGGTVLEYFAKVTKKAPLVTKQNIRSTIANRIFSIEKAIKDFGYSPVSNVEEEIHKTVKWYEDSGHI